MPIAITTDGSIVFKRKVARPDPENRREMRARLQGGPRATVEGNDIEIAFESICFHSDTPGALEIGRAIREGLTGAGITIASAATVLEQTN